MASCSKYSLLYTSASSSVPSSKFSILSSMIHSRRQPPVVLKEKSGGLLGFSDLKQQKGFGCSIPLLQRNSWFESIGRRCNKGWGSEGEGGFSLETEILKFMDGSENPNKFPTKKDLIDAGRGDLLDSIQKNSEWLAKNWDLDQEKPNAKTLEERMRERNMRLLLHLGVCLSEKKSAEEDDAEIIGILKRLEKERNDSREKADDLSCKNDYPDDDHDDHDEHKGEKETDTDLSCKNGYYDAELKLGSLIVSDCKPATTASLKTSNDSYPVSEATDFGKGSVSDFDSMRDTLKPDTWSSQREGLSQIDFEAAEIGLDVATDNIVVQKNVNETEEEGSPYVQTDQWFRSRVQYLELELASTLRSLKSASEIDISSLKETEVMNAKKKLRSIRAKLEILEGKVALAAIDSNKNLDMKHKRINAAQLGLTTLHDVGIVWPDNKALEVLVCGSFDGWTSQRMMERSDLGFLILNLKLYPGRYEFKFIVDGVPNDPLGPIASNSGYENYMLVVS